MLTLLSSKLNFGKFAQHAERESLQPDVDRALRSMIAITVPLLLASVHRLPASLNLVFFIVAAQSISFVVVRGAYPVRLGVLLAGALAMTTATWLGETAAPSPTVSVLS